MAYRFKLRTIRKKLRRLRTKKNALILGGLGVLCAAMVYGIIMQSRIVIDPVAYKPLLNVIAKGESRGNYNAYFGEAGNTEIRFTDMTIAEVLDWQQKYIAEGSPSSAVGRYQIIRPTLESLVKELNLDTAARFDEALQDRLAIALMERRGSVAFIAREVSAETFAHSLSKEWAALPKATGEAPEQSYYAGDGLNAAQIGLSEILSGIEAFRQQAD